MKTRIFHTKFWTDSYILTLPTDARCLYSYYLTNDRIGLTGIYELPQALVTLSTGLTIENIDIINARLMADKKIAFYADWVCVVNSSKYQSYVGSKNDTARLREEELIPLEVRGFFSKYTIDTVSETENSLINQKSKIINKKSEIEGSEDQKQKIRLMLEEKGLRRPLIDKNAN